MKSVAPQIKTLACDQMEIFSNQPLASPIHSGFYTLRKTFQNTSIKRAKQSWILRALNLNKSFITINFAHPHCLQFQRNFKWIIFI